MNTTRFLKALADDTRLRTFRTLAEAGVGLCVAEMADILQKPQYAVSRSLIELRKAGLLNEDRQGKFVYYALTEPSPVRELGRWTLNNCLCTDESSCEFDSERLTWRLSLREPEKDPPTRPADQQKADLRPRVLFVCVHNSARSQLAEEYLRRAAGDQFFVESAGLTPGTLNPHVVALLNEQGIDISGKATQAVTNLYRRGETYEWVIAVCSRDAERDCPLFPGPVRRLSWPFSDPAGFTGDDAEVASQVRRLAQEIEQRVKDFVEEHRPKEKT
jgi:arsenate reductase